MIHKLKLFKDEIKELLESEIIGRYYYQNGQKTQDLKHDEYVLKAIGTIENKEEYNSILNP